MNIYHGSKAIIDKPIYKGSEKTNDYGPSFYLTVDLDAAKAWACRNDSLGLVNEYYIDERSFKNLKILDLTQKDQYSVLNWLAILMHFRTLSKSFIAKNRQAIEWLKQFYINVDEYDVVIGYRADDSYFRFPTSFISNDLSFDDLEDVFLSGHLGVQYAFMSEKAIKLLKYRRTTECEPAFLGRHYSAISKASEEFDELLNRPRDFRKTYIFDMMREER